MSMLKSFFDLTAMDDAVDEMLEAMDTLSVKEFEDKVNGLSKPAKFLAKHTIQADLNSDIDPDRARNLGYILTVLDRD